MPSSPPVNLDPCSAEHFRAHGWRRLPAAFSAHQAAAMRETVWRALERAGIRQHDRSTWTKERPDHLQSLKADPVFQAVGSPRTLKAVGEALEGQSWSPPRNWGAFFLIFPTRREWRLPTSTWHLDANYAGPLSPPVGVSIRAFYADIEPRAGGTLIVSGSHRLVHRWFLEHPPAPGWRHLQMRKSLQQHPYIRDLHADGDPGARLERFFGRTEEVDGIPLQVLENTAKAGDVILMHPLLLHSAPTANAGSQPRFLLSGGVAARSDA